MKIATAGAILATVASTTEGKKSKTSNDFYNSKDGDRFAARFDTSSSSSSSSSDSDDWWYRSGKAGKGGKSGSSGSSSSSCRLRTYYLDLDDILDDIDTKVNRIDMTYANFKVYKDEDDVGNSNYDGVLSLERKYVSEFSCQAQGMLGLDGGPIFEDQIYFSSMCDPDENDPEEAGYITDGGITGGFGFYAGATGEVKYETSGDVGELKMWICLR